jgi:hypothetical protein
MAAPSSLHAIPPSLIPNESTRGVLQTPQALGMGGLQLGLGASASKFKKVMNEPRGRQTVYMAGGGALFLFLVYLWLR